MECSKCQKETHRDEKSKKELTSRINRIIGQMNGVKKMIDEDRYCDDILIQISAVNSALKSLGQEILLNQNLNTIIGGRSTGKSTLLSSIAIKFDDTLNIENKDFIEKLGDNVHVYWRDGQENNQKNIEYFPQNHINQIADIKYSDKLLLQILLDNPEKKTFYEKYQSDISDMFSIIQSNVSLYFEKRRLYNEKILNIKNIGDIEGIKREISKLQEVRIGLQSKLTSNQELMAAYEKAVEELNQLKLLEQEHQKEINSLKQLSGEKFVVLNTTISFLGLSKEHCNSLITSINNSIIDANKNIYKAIDAFILQENEQLKSIQEKIQVIIRSNGYNDGKRIFEENKSLNQVIDNLSLLNSKLSLINKETEIANRLRDEYKEIGQKLLQLHISYLDKINNIASEMRLQHDDVNLSSEIILKPSLEKMLNECLSLRSAAMNDLISKTIAEYQKKTKTNVMLWLKELLNKAVKNELTFKNGYDIQSFVSKLLAECWFDLTLNVEYDGDNLRDMSPGKRSFVILKLLLDFSDKKCPILIDQPEDNLDNRAIYNELVKYIKKKKRERQIILVTHNPRIIEILKPDYVHIIKDQKISFTGDASLAKEIEQKGIALAYKKAKQADLVIYLFDALKDCAQDIEKYKKEFSDKLVVVANKQDKISSERIAELQKAGCLVISAKQNTGTDKLLSVIKEHISSRFTSNSGLLISRRRYREALKNTLEFLNDFNFEKEIELTAEDIRLAAREIGKITGRIEVEEILDKIFGSFCIGK